MINDTLEQARQEWTKWTTCTACELHRTRRYVVFGEGSIPAPLVFIGDAPGRLEDESGRPCMGDDGGRLRFVANKLGIDLQRTFITNILGCRAPGNRDPLPPEVEACRPRWHRLLELAEPKVVVLLGRVASIATAGVGLMGIGKARGRWGQVVWDDAQGNRRTVAAMPTYHPSYLLKMGADSKEHMEFEADLLAAAQEAGLIRPAMPGGCP